MTLSIRAQPVHIKCFSTWLVFILLLIGAGCGPSDDNDDDDSTPDESCAGTADDGVIDVPEECPSLQSASQLASDNGPGTVIRLQSGNYKEYGLSFDNGTKLLGVDAEDRPVIAIESAIGMNSSTIENVVVAGELKLQDSVAINAEASTGKAWGTIHLEDTVVSGYFTGGSSDDDRPDVLILRSTLPDGDFETTGAVSILESEIGDLVLSDGTAEIAGSSIGYIDIRPNQLTVPLAITATSSTIAGFKLEDGTVTATDCVITGRVWIDTGADEAVQFTATDSSLSSIDAAGMFTLELVRTTIHNDSEDIAIHLHGESDYDEIAFTMTNSYLTTSGKLFRLDGGDSGGIPFGTQEIVLYNNVLTGGAFEITQGGNCFDYSEALELTMKNNIFVGVNVYLHVEEALVSLSSPNNLYWDSTFDCVEGHSWMDGGVCTSSSSTEFNLLTEEGSVEGDPLFVSFNAAELTAADLHLQGGSPAIDAGDPESTFNDQDGTRNDMGMYGGPAAPSTAE